MESRSSLDQIVDNTITRKGNDILGIISKALTDKGYNVTPILWEDNEVRFGIVEKDGGKWPHTFNVKVEATPAAFDRE